MSVTASHFLTTESKPAGCSWRVRLSSGLLACTNGVRRFPAFISRLLIPALSVLTEGISLGLMRRTDVDDLVANTYQTHTRHYDPRHYQPPYESRILPVLQSYAPGPRMLDAFCGQGREAEVFAGGGFDVTGVDRMPAMIESAQRFAAEQSFAANFVVADFEALNVSPGFDVVYSSSWMYSTQQGADRRSAFLHRCCQLCADGGLIVFSTVRRPARSLPGTTLRFAVARLTSWLTLGNTATEFGERLYSGLFWHHLSVTQVRRELQQAGLRIQHVESGEGAEPTFFFVVAQTPDRAV
ncbi:MAG: class I SAM-dependent methyltransferase [Planctomycetaceae bacterium]|nr:class I SAM-dependent methyltransferase [Planctomycetaceae bacterium]